ncbi:type II iodothyronine deiodinase-like [Dendronephthya gigantea]|uniref:type II iodothyronine deiodinase-like n=1 Tax=Dendronephthya gigantea TaxID=151771 RepID=UPI00106B2523|nr:type II iodothyronine deiodinase-like [Dendronephthya gigantea]
MAVNSIVIQKLREFLLFLQLCCIFVIGNTILRLSYAQRITSSIMENAAGMVLPEEIFRNALFTREMMKALWEVYVLDMKKSASYGQKAPDPTLVDPNTGEEKHLSKALDVQKLQVLAFGSYTCPVFRRRFTELQALAEEFHQVAEFSVIYIDEAHPSDGWAFKDEVEISKHQSLEDRLNAAQQFSSAYCKHSPIRMFADSMKNEASTMYGVGAIRLYVLYNETVLYEGGVGPTYYNVEEVKQAIKTRNESCVVV